MAPHLAPNPRTEGRQKGAQNAGSQTPRRERVGRRLRCYAWFPQTVMPVHPNNRSAAHMATGYALPPRHIGDHDTDLVINTVHHALPVPRRTRIPMHNQDTVIRLRPRGVNKDLESVDAASCTQTALSSASRGG